MKFIDLFAGLGGFHIALRKAGIRCVFASEIDSELRALYSENFKMQCSGDIAKIKEEDIPRHDVLCAGFPCQPFSKAGKQKGLKDAGRGDMIFEIVRILRHCQPRYFILENVPNLKCHDNGRTWKEIVSLLSGCGYSVRDFILSPHHFGIPNNRKRLFIVGCRSDVKKSLNLEFKGKNETSATNIIGYLAKSRSKGKPKRLSERQLECLSVWQKLFISRLPEGRPLPTFPVWAMEFGASYPLDRSPYYLSSKDLGKCRGAFGVSLKGLPKKAQLSKLPVYASYKEKKMPLWKVNYIQKNRDFWKENEKRLDGFIPEIKGFANSWQKLEWNAGEGRRDIFKYLLQFRSSGIRVKKTDSVPSLVLTSTQIPVVAWQKRYLSLAEAQKLQGFESIRMPDQGSRSFKALGNAVNTLVVEKIVESLGIAPKQGSRTLRRAKPGVSASGRKRGIFLSP